MEPAGDALTLTVHDDDAPVSIRAAARGLKVLAGRRTARYVVVLNQQPSSKVVLVVKAPVGLRVSRRTVVFTARNWNVPRTLVVSVDGARSARAGAARKPRRARSVRAIQHRVVSQDPVFSRLRLPAVRVVIADAST